MKTNSGALREGCKIGFTQARENPDQSLDEFMEAIDGLQTQLEKLPSWKLRLLSGDGNVLDRFRLRRCKEQV